MTLFVQDDAKISNFGMDIADSLRKSYYICKQFRLYPQ